MTALELRDSLIEDGIASIEKNETRRERVRGGKAGFELCRSLDTPEAFQRLLSERRGEERTLISMGVDAQEYWEYRMATIQIEFVWERMAVAWSMDGPHSARAVLHVDEKIRLSESK